MNNRRCRGDDGTIAVETAVLFAVVISALLYLPIAGGLWWWGREAAASAAEQAAVVGSRANATSDETGRAASTVLSQTGNLRDVTVRVDRNPNRVIVTVDGTSMFGFSVSAAAQAPIERPYSAGER